MKTKFFLFFTVWVIAMTCSTSLAQPQYRLSIKISSEHSHDVPIVYWKTIIDDNITLGEFQKIQNLKESCYQTTIHKSTTFSWGASPTAFSLFQMQERDIPLSDLLWKTYERTIYLSNIKMSVCPLHRPTIRPLEITFPVRKQSPILLQAEYDESAGYEDADFEWEYSLDGINFFSYTNNILPKTGNFTLSAGKNLNVQLSNIPNAKPGKPIFFRLKYCDDFPSYKANGSPPVIVSFMDELPHFANPVLLADVRCPGEIPQPLFVPFARKLKETEEITNVYLFRNYGENGKILDRMDLEHSIITENGITIQFPEVLQDGNYFLMMEGLSNGVAASSANTIILVKNPPALLFEKTVSPSSGIEYHQDIPKTIADGKIGISIKNYLDDCSILWNETAYKTSDTCFDRLSSGIYSTQIRFNANQCDTTISSSVELLDNTLHVRIEEGLPITCYGHPEASLQAVVQHSPANSDVSFSWYKNGDLLPNETELYLENLSAGTYLVACESEKLQSTFSFTVSEPRPLELTVKSAAHPLCHGSNDGHIHIKPNGGIPPYRYVWGHGETSSFAHQLSAGSYSVTIFDQNNCSISDSTILNEPEPLLAEAVEKIEQSYFGSEPGFVKPSDHNGLIRISTKQGTPPYTYKWSNGSTDSILTNLSFGTFHVTVSDFNSCKQTLSIELPQRFPLTSTLHEISSISCFESNNAVLKATVEGGIPPYRYRWKHNNDTILRQSELAIGTYEFEATDSRGVQSFDRIYVSQPEPLRVVLSTDSVSGWGASDGSVHAVANGGTPPYTFDWGHSTAASATGLQAGTYYLQLADANGCWLKDSISVKTPDSLTLTGRAYSCTYPGAIQGIVPTELNDGRIDCHVEGGVKPYTYCWFYQQPNDEWIPLTSKRTSYIDSLTSGRYALMVTDNKGYSISDTFVVIKTKPLITTISASSPLCFGSSDGVLQAIVNGGTPPYSYRWNLGDSTVLLQGLTAGHYAVIVQDSLGILSTFETIITQPEPLTVDCSVKEISGYGLNTGAISSFVQGGTKPYSYFWTDHDTISRSPQILNLHAGVYTLQVIDANGCNWSSSFALNNPEILTVDALTKPVSYRGSVQGRLTSQPADGELYLTASGGFPPYTYNWSNGKKTSYLTGLSKGSYSVTVTDKNGNEAYKVFDVKASEPLRLTLTQDRLIACAGEFSARLTSHVSGGTPPYTYLWNNEKIETFIDSLTTGSYYLIVTDSLGITANFTIQIDEPAPLVMAENVIQPWCPNPTNGAISLFVSGGVPPYQYHWNTFTQTAQLRGLSSGVYCVTATDANGCKKNQAFRLQTPLTAYIEQVDYIRCFGDSNAILRLNVCGGVPPYNICWDTGDSIMTLTGRKSGLYNATITDTEGHFIKTTYTITEPEKLHLELGPDQILCQEQTFPMSFLNDDFTYFWQKNGSFFHFGKFVTLSETGEYTVIMEDFNGCKAFDTLHIKSLPDRLDAEFWHSHEAITNEDFVVANIGQSAFDSVVWTISPTTRILSQSEDYFLLRFSDTGHYEIRLTTYKNGCSEEQAGVVRVITPNENFRLKSSTMKSLSNLKLFPNPARDQFNFSVHSKRFATLNWMLTHVGTGVTVLSGQIKSDSNGLATQQISLQKQLCGVYVFRVFTGKEQLSTQLVIH